MWGVAATLTATLLLYLITRIWLDNPLRDQLRERRIEQECKRLLAAFRQMSGEMPADDLDAVLLVEDAAKRAQAKDPSTAVHRLIDSGLIAPLSGQQTPDYIRMTPAGLGAALPSEPKRPWWRRLFGE